VSHVLECFCAVLAADVEEDFFAASACTLAIAPKTPTLRVAYFKRWVLNGKRDVRMLIHKAARIVHLVVHDDEQVLLGVVLRDV
jgi:hypothetical protein